MTTLPAPVDFKQVRAMLAGRSRTNDGFGLNSWSVTTQDVIYTWTIKNSQVLRLRGRWRGVAADEESVQYLQKAVMRCNSQRVAPKAYLVPTEIDGQFSVVAETAILIDQGMTETQFYGFCESSYAAVMGFLMEIEMHLPQLVTWKESA